MKRRIAAASAAVAGAAVLAHGQQIRPEPGVARPSPAPVGPPAPLIHTMAVSPASPLVPATTTPEPVRVVSAAPARTGLGDWRALVEELWGVEAPTALRVVWCESRDEAEASNPSGAHGLFQVIDGSFDPIANVWEAWRLYKARGWEPWTASERCWAA